MKFAHFGDLCMKHYEESMVEVCELHLLPPSYMELTSEILEQMKFTSYMAFASPISPNHKGPHQLRNPVTGCWVPIRPTQSWVDRAYGRRTVSGFEGERFLLSCDLEAKPVHEVKWVGCFAYAPDGLLKDDPALPYLAPVVTISVNGQLPAPFYGD